MFNSIKVTLLVTLLFLSVATNAQTIKTTVEGKYWTASWISYPNISGYEYGVYLFRKNINLTDAPAKFIVHVSADNRYKLFVNEKLVSLGPARGDLAHWNYETVDIGPFLMKGDNVVAAKVWNEGKLRPEAQMSVCTGFILQGNSEKEDVINTNESWKCCRDSSYEPIPMNKYFPNTYYVAGPGEKRTMYRQIKGWEKNNFDDSNWQKAQELYLGTPDGGTNSPNGVWLVPSTIPPRELTYQRLRKVRKAENVSVPDSFPAKSGKIIVAAKTSAKILLDQTFLTNAYPTLCFSKGKDAEIIISYAESLFEKDMNKGNRNEIEGKVFSGRRDEIISDGSDAQEFTSLLWRAFRYLQLEIRTKDEPLEIDDIFGTFTGYPFELRAKFHSENALIDSILAIGWRSARLCAFETYMDTPVYEQLQYIGDTRIQALVSLFNSGDDRLMRNAITMADNSRTPQGITLSRNPSCTPQIIPPFSLFWIGMLHDYWMYRSDEKFVKDKLPGVHQIISFFQRYQDADGSLKDVPYWCFADWVDDPKWGFGIAPKGKDGCSSILDLELLLGYETAYELESSLGNKGMAEEYKQNGERLKNTIRQKYWDNNKLLFADTPELTSFSQHANALAIITETIAGKDAPLLAKRMLADPSLAQASIYFKYYLHRALIKAGLGNDYMDWLSIWKENIKMGLTTWSEISDINRARSDCHAWGASPNIEFYRTVLGIDSYAPGFAKVRIEPHLGTMKKAGGEIPHPKGTIAVNYSEVNGKWNIEIILPQATSGVLLWEGNEYTLSSGGNHFEIKKK